MRFYHCLFYLHSVMMPRVRPWCRQRPKLTKISPHQGALFPISHNLGAEQNDCLLRFSALLFVWLHRRRVQKETECTAVHMLFLTLSFLILCMNREVAVAVAGNHLLLYVETSFLIGLLLRRLPRALLWFTSCFFCTCSYFDPYRLGV